MNCLRIGAFLHQSAPIMVHHEELLLGWEKVFEKYSVKGLGQSKEVSRGGYGLGIGLRKEPLIQAEIAAAEERLSELLRILRRQIGTGAVVPEQFSARLIHFYRAVLHPQDR